MELASAISMLSARAHLDDRGREILAAAIRLRDCTGRERLGTLRAMCTTWGVQRQDKSSGKPKERPCAALDELLTNAVCSAAAQFLHASEQRGAAEQVAPALLSAESTGSGAGAAEHVPTASSSTGRQSPDASTEARPAKKAKTTWAQLDQRAVPLPPTADDVLTLCRLGPDLYRATKRSGETWLGDSELLRTLPQGIARLATLQVQERKAAHAAEDAGAPEHVDRAAAEAKAEDVGAPEHVGAPENAEPAEKKARTDRAVQDELDSHTDASVPWLFRDGADGDRSLVGWGPPPIPSNGLSVWFSISTK